MAALIDPWIRVLAARRPLEGRAAATAPGAPSGSTAASEAGRSPRSPVRGELKGVVERRQRARLVPQARRGQPVGERPALGERPAKE